ncbi:hypothetical protein [Mycolicibacterium palauense]|uniref:hypothetical protein n=1 Tax=Mycolicibacterium palauense TaxID=2034511 RepID=UPI00159BAE03|nr:hypothetical protein [Mycolicibacterium palauense]
MAAARSVVRRPATPAPMLATLGPPPSGDQWAVEWKMDGRASLIVDRGEVVTFSRNGADVKPSLLCPSSSKCRFVLVAIP